jgi:glycosyltransferase involved in cell wall biosynthesis
MTFPNRNAAGTGIFARELLAELQQRDDVDMHPVAGEARGIASTIAWLTYGAHRATAGSQLVHCPAFVTPWRLSAPLVVTVHDMSITRYPADHPLEWRTYARYLLPERIRSAARVIASSESTRRDIIRDLGVPEDRVAVAHGGVSERFAQAFRSQKPLSDPPQMLFPGGPAKRKNLDLVLQAMAHAPEGSVLRRARLVISGVRGERFPKYQQLINSLGLAERVVWRGPMPAELMPALMAEADVLVYPSWNEGFGFPPLEAMLAGTPVVASNVSSIPEVVGDAGLLVDPNDVPGFIAAVESVLTREELRRELIAKGRARASRFTWKRCAELTVQVYKEAVSDGPGPRG